MLELEKMCCRIVECMIDVNVIVTHNKRVLAWVIIFIPTVTALTSSVPRPAPGITTSWPTLDTSPPVVCIPAARLTCSNEHFVPLFVRILSKHNPVL